jgi:ankyrin repeat protein
MLTLQEVLEDAAALDEFAGLSEIHVNTRGVTGQTPLHWMATLGDVAAADLLVKAGAVVDAQDRQGNSPLHEAVRSRQHLVVRLLVERGARTGLKNVAGDTPLTLAESERYAPTLEALRDAV